MGLRLAAAGDLVDRVVVAAGTAAALDLAALDVRHGVLLFRCYRILLPSVYRAVACSRELGQSCQAAVAQPGNQARDVGCFLEQLSDGARAQPGNV